MELLVVPAALRAVLAAVAALGWLVWSPPAPAAAAGAVWAWPLAGPVAVARPFVPPAHRYGVGHRGADLPAPPGAPVRAAGHGRVSYAGLVAGRGVVVVVHGPLRTTYEPVTATVALGAVVSAGEVIGVLDAGHAGCPAPACLHWGLRRGDDYLDPVRLVEPGPVRLLPVEPRGPPAAAVIRDGAAGSAAPGPVQASGVPPPSGAVALRAMDGEPAAQRPPPTTAGLAGLGAGLALAAAAHGRVARHG